MEACVNWSWPTRSLAAELLVELPAVNRTVTAELISQLELRKGLVISLVLGSRVTIVIMSHSVQNSSLTGGPVLKKGNDSRVSWADPTGVELLG